MARGNRRQKPIEQLQNKRGGRTEQRVVLLPRNADRPAPPMPRDLPEELVPAWDAFIADPLSNAIQLADGYDLGRFFMLLARREALEAGLYRLDPQTGEYVGLTEAGSQGQAVIHPHFAVVKELTREIEKYREELGILPRSRMKLGIATGNAQEATVRGIRAGLDRQAAPQKRVFGKGAS